VCKKQTAQIYYVSSNCLYQSGRRIELFEVNAMVFFGLFELAKEPGALQKVGLQEVMDSRGICS
jgi:hypothetical protein